MMALLLGRALWHSLCFICLAHTLRGNINSVLSHTEGSQTCIFIFAASACFVSTRNT